MSTNRPKLLVKNVTDHNIIGNIREFWILEQAEPRFDEKYLIYQIILLMLVPFFSEHHKNINNFKKHTFFFICVIKISKS